MNYTPDILRIEKAVKEVTGYDLEDMKINTRKVSLLYAKMLFSHEARKEGLTYDQIGDCISRHHSTVMYYERIFDDELNVNNHFKTLYEMMRNVLKV